MRRYIFKTILLVFLISPLAMNVYGVNAAKKYQKKRHSVWNSLIPDYHNLQYAGSMGFLSLGTGWEYGRKDSWETEILIGFIPQFKDEDGHLTFTIKENYIPWRFKPLPRYSQKIEVEPLTVGLYINKIFGEHFWQKLPDRYPKKYYVMATNLRFNICLGQRLTYNFNEGSINKSISFFYEFSTNDLYVIQFIKNKSLTLHEILGLSFGIKMTLYWD